MCLEHATPQETLALARIHATRHEKGQGGVRVATNVFLRDLNIGTPLTDGRRLEVVANGLPGHQGAQVAVDVTFFSPVARGAAAADAAARKRRETYPEFSQAPRARLAVLALEIGGRRGDDCEHFLRVLAAGRAQAAPLWQRSFPSRRRAASPRRCWSSRSRGAARRPPPPSSRTSRRTRGCSPVHSVTSRSSPLLPGRQEDDEVQRLRFGLLLLMASMSTVAGNSTEEKEKGGTDLGWMMLVVCAVIGALSTGRP